MVSKEDAEDILKSKMAENLVIVEDWETETDWVFMLGLKSKVGKIKPLSGDNTIHISKDNGEMT